MILPGMKKAITEDSRYEGRESVNVWSVMTPKKNMIKVTQVRARRYPDRLIQGARVYVDSSAGKAVDKFFSENKIAALKFKCSTWNAVKRKAVESDVADMKTIFGEDAEIRWSRTAGCSCACSPGYVVEGKIKPEFRNSDVWVEIKTSTAHITKLFPDFKKKLAAEIAKKNS